MAPRHVRILTILACGALVSAVALAQSKGGTTPPSSGSSGTGTSTGTGTVTRTPSNLPTNTTPNSPTTTNVPRPIFLSGRVVIDDGTPLPEPVSIVRVCGGNPHTEGYTDSQGNFAIEFGNEQGVLQDAETAGVGAQTPGMSGGGSGMGGLMSSGMSRQRQLDNCELQAKLVGYRSQGVILAGRQPMDDPNIGTILLHRNAKSEEGNTVSAKSLAAPKDARKAFDKGLELMKKAKVDDAFREFQKAVMIYPSYATAWCELGKIEAERGQFDIARGSFNEAAKADPKYVDPYLELSRIALNDKNWPELAQFTGKAITLDSFDYPQEFLFDAVAHYNMHDYETAQKSILRAESLDTRKQFPQIAYLKGLVQLQHKDYSGAAENMRTYLKLAPNAEDAAKVREQLAQLEKYLSQTASKQ